MEKAKTQKEAEAWLEALNGQVFEMTIELEKVQKQVASLSANRNDTILSADKIVWDKKVEADNIIVAAKAQADQIIAEAQAIRDKASEEREILNKRSAEIHAQAQVIPDGIAQLQADRQAFEDARKGKLEELDAKIKVVAETQAKLESQMATVTSVQVSNEEKAKKVDAQILDLATLIESNTAKAKTNTAKENELIAREAVADNRAKEVADGKEANKVEAERLQKEDDALSTRESEVNKTASDNAALKTSLDAQAADIKAKNEALQTGMATLKEGQDSLAEKGRANALKDRDIDDKIKTLKLLREQPVK